MARRHRTAGRCSSTSRTARSTSPAPRARFTPHAAGAALPLDSSSSRRAIPRSIMREYARITGLPEMPRAVDARLPAVAPHARRRATRSCGIARTFREKKLPCDALIYLGTGLLPVRLEHATTASSPGNRQNFPDPEGDARRAARRALQGRAARRDRGPHAHRHA